MSVFERIQGRHEYADWSAKMREWINDIPDHPRTCALAELHINKPPKRKLDSCGRMQKKKAAASKRTGGSLLNRPEAADNLPTHDKVTTSRPMTRAAQRQRQQAQLQDVEDEEAAASQKDLVKPLALCYPQDGDAQKVSFEGGAPALAWPLMVPSSVPKNLSSSPRKATRSSSPSKSSSFLDVGRLWLYEPRIRFISYGDAKLEGLLRDGVRALWLGFIEPSTRDAAPIPQKLKVKIDSILDTPEKSRAAPPPSAYRCSDIYSDQDLRRMDETIHDVLSSAEKWRSPQTPEAHWCDRVVLPLLNLARQLDCASGDISPAKPKVETLTISSLEIQPPELYPIPSKSLESSMFGKLNKKVDYALGLQLLNDDIKILERASYNSSGFPSINQTATFANFVPMFLSVEVKTHVPYSNPGVQLGVWVAAEFRKREIEGYDRSMPVLAIAVTGDDWQIYIAYDPEPDSVQMAEVVFLGPIPMGSTENLSDVWRIMNTLAACINWGRSLYSDWFRANVLEFHRQK